MSDLTRARAHAAKLRTHARRLVDIMREFQSTVAAIDGHESAIYAAMADAGAAVKADVPGRRDLAQKAARLVGPHYRIVDERARKIADLADAAWGEI